LATVKVAVYEKHKGITVCTVYIFRFGRNSVLWEIHRHSCWALGSFLKIYAEKAVNIGRKWNYIYAGTVKPCDISVVKNAMLNSLSTWSFLEIRMRDEVTIWRLIMAPLKGSKSSDIWKQS